MKNLILFFIITAFSSCMFESNGYMKEPIGTAYVVYYPDSTTDTVRLDGQTWVFYGERFTQIYVENSVKGLEKKYRTNNPVKAIFEQSQQP